MKSKLKNYNVPVGLDLNRQCPSSKKQFSKLMRSHNRLELGEPESVNLENCQRRANTCSLNRI